MTRACASRHELNLGALYAEVDHPVERDRHWPMPDAATSPCRRVHVMSPAAGGEVRSYWLDADDRLWLAAPCYSSAWCEADSAVARVLGAALVPYTVTAGGGVDFGG